MKFKKWTSLILIFILLLSMSMACPPLAFADTVAYSGIDISTGHSFPIQVIIGPDEKLYVTEYSRNKIIRMDKDGQNKTTFATGFSQPIGMVFDSVGNLYVAEHNGSKVTKVDTSGTTSLVKNIGGGYLTGIVIDSNNKIFALDYTGGKIYKMDLDGNNYSTFVTGLTTNSIIGLAIDANDNLYVSERSSGKVLKVEPNATITDFVSGISTIQGVTLGKDGYFYTSSSSRNIEKIDLDGTKLRVFSTGTVNPWGLSTDSDGTIFFGESSSTVRKIVGSAETQNTTSLKITLNREVGGTQADPTAFTISGVASNPQVTTSVVSGSSIILTLNAHMTTLDTSIKVHYAKTGTDNLTVSGSAIEFNNFSNLSVKNNIIRVLSVATIPQINVAHGTDLASLNLPNTISLNLSNSTTSSTAVTWNSGTPVYNGNTSGTYAFSGTFSVSENVSNPNNVKAAVNVVVGEAPTLPNIDSVASISNINVANGTVLGSVGLPTTATVTLSNSATSSAAVTWDSGTPVYDANIAGTYIFSGTLSLDGSFLNPGNLKASVNVVVSESQTVLNVVSVASIPNLTVANGTAVGSIGLPATATVTLSNSTTSSAAVTWDSGTPVYNANTAGTYVFSGTLGLDGSFLNSGNLKASVNVIVGAASPVPSEPTDNSPSITVPELSPPKNDNTIIKVNGEEQRIGTENRTTENGKSKVEVTVISGSMEKIIAAILKEGANNPTPPKNIVEINVVDSSANMTVVGLTGEIVKMLDQNSFDVLIKKGTTSYNIPATELTVDAVAQKFAVNQDQLKSIKFEIQIQQMTVVQQNTLAEKVKANNSELMIPPAEFSIIAKVEKADGTSDTMVISNFTQYVERTFEIPSNINETDITTGIVFNEDQTYSHVPTNIFTKNGINYAQLNSLTNSTYSVIKNPITVANVKGHWSESVVNDMASRLVIVNSENFNADAKITRGELAEYLVRALGLYRNDHTVTLKFKDVSAENKNAIGISIASQWSIISGYTDGNFRANAALTREEAMVMYAKAMTITQSVIVPDSTNTNNSNVSGVSEWAKPFVLRTLNSKIFVGRSVGSLELKEQLTHAEALVAIKNILTNTDLINKN
jgi:sugar lactone lactonase YvrE